MKVYKEIKATEVSERSDRVTADQINTYAKDGWEFECFMDDGYRALLSRTSLKEVAKAFIGYGDWEPHSLPADEINVSEKDGDALVCETIEASKISSYGFFRKVGGAYVYKIISPSSAAHPNLDASKVYGVAYNGNTATVWATTLVHPATVEEMIKNARDEQDFSKNVLGADTRPPSLCVDEDKEEF